MRETRSAVFPISSRRVVRDTGAGERTYVPSRAIFAWRAGATDAAVTNLQNH